MKFRIGYRPVDCLNAGFDFIFPCSDKVEKSGIHMASQLCLDMVDHLTQTGLFSAGQLTFVIAE
jgi:hypothetical protein